MDKLPRFKPDNAYLVSGKTLNLIHTAIRKRTPKAGSGLESQETPQGVVLKRK